MRRIVTTGFAMLVLGALATAVAGQRDPALAGYFSAPLRIDTGTASHEFVVYLAVTPLQRAHGLMHVRELPANHGMLFLYEPPQRANMWMKNTPLSLDMLFIRADGTIASIVSDTEPGSLVPILSREAVMGVLELNAGTAAKLGIRAGDRIVYRAFRSASADAS